MPSFSQITALATVALAAFTTAAPVARDAASDLLPLPAVFQSLLSELTPVAAELSSISILTGGVAQISALAGAPLSTILSTADGVIDATGAAQLLAPVLTIVFTATQDVLNVVDNSPAAAVITPLLNEAIGALNPVLSTAAPLVNGLFAALGPLLGPSSTPSTASASRPLSASSGRSFKRFFVAFLTPIHMYVMP
ncbi:hypothetical protein B0H14DRAFT_3504477 [Mycena olivaceomarginata]|nr:hypothetical protein B0H14DRAFT_3504477 [Mycena olivaceomarginata]